MNDTTQRALSYEDELKVLDVVRRIGEEKGLDLLTVEQKKKLAEAGSIGNQHEEKSVGRLLFIIEGVVYGLLEKCKKEILTIAHETEYEPTEADLSGIVWDKFVFDYGMDPTTFKEILIRNCSGATHATTS